MLVRISRIEELELIKQVHMSAFGHEERASITKLVSDFLNSDKSNEILSYVCLLNQKIIGHIIFSKVIIPNSNIQAYILAPLAVDSRYQNQGVGTALILKGISRLIELKIDYIFVYGDPAYYSKFLFRQEGANQFVPPYPLEFPLGWQIRSLNQNKVTHEPMSFTCLEPLMNSSLW